MTMMMQLLFVALLAICSCNAALIGGGLLGGYQDVSKDEADVQDVVSFVESTLNSMSNSLYNSRVSDVTRVQRQLVNGLNYKIEFVFSGTKCSKMSMIALKSCPLSEKVEKCTAQVYQSFSGERQLNDFDCQRADNMNRRAGAISGPVVNPEKYRAQALRAMSVANSDLDASTMKVMEVRTQVVAGLLLYMKIQGLNDGVLTMCDMTVWSREWIAGADGFQVQNNKCRPLEVSRRALAGGVSKKMPVDDVTKGIFLEALDDSNLSLDLSETKFISMTRQVVAGIKYVIYLQTKRDGKEVKCQVTVLSQPWMSPPSTVLDSDC